MKYEKIGQSIGELVDQKQRAYGDSFGKTGPLLRIYLSEYKQADGSYLIPDALIDHIPVQVRMIDKQNRIFSNPEGDLMGESPYTDMAGYSLLGVEMSKRVTAPQTCTSCSIYKDPAADTAHCIGCEGSGK